MLPQSKKSNWIQKSVKKKQAEVISGASDVQRGEDEWEPTVKLAYVAEGQGRTAGTQVI